MRDQTKEGLSGDFRQKVLPKKDPPWKQVVKMVSAFERRLAALPDGHRAFARAVASP